MAQKTIVELIDDLDGTEAEETVFFGIDGQLYEIDLSKKNADKLRKTLGRYKESARKANAKPAKKSTRTSSPREDTVQIRKWAKDNGYTVNERGRIPQSIVDAYRSGTSAKQSGVGDPFAANGS
ncbi:Lsr2 protein [Murinocardiopsis flavida]|uniref:Lsr2 protein n=1 Tax=Murinocardiopsis flavida TaxID=645275 RepID=A0A2P8DFD2_9ACTN|nr:Lsr2 family protein [Murinocardiopsis flavida]PSK95907.1 Lsr2 protein [Murinocardiopsis flavida]